MQSAVPNDGQGHLSAFDERRLQRAVAHVNHLWFPVNPDVFDKIKNGLAEGRYDLGMEFLIEDLKTDYALYTYCIRELSKALRQDGLQVSLKDPIQFLQIAGIGRLKKIFEVEPLAISRHDPDTMTFFQAKQFEASIVSASTAQLLSHTAAGVEPDIAYLTALLRQLGLTLIAWNYPTVYQQALDQQSEKRDLDGLLSSKLGFSPVLLAVKVIKEWGVAPEIELALRAVGSEAGGTDDKTVQAGDFLAHLCFIGESLARANQPEIYPSAKDDWIKVKKEIERSLGPEGLRTIEKQVRDYCAGYSKSHPDLFRAAKVLNPETNIHKFEERQLLHKNQFVEQCAPVLKFKFKEFYVQHARTGQVRESIIDLIKNVFPYTGFTAGCVYTLDAGTLTLVPRLKISTPELRPLKSVSVQPSSNRSDPVLMAFECNAPISAHVSHAGLSYIVSSLGARAGAAVGVLYVELPTPVDDKNSPHVAHFKALRQAFHDLLGIQS